MPLRVLHLVGSPTSGFFADLSRLYAADCLAALADPGAFTPLVAYVTPDGAWRFPDDLSAAAIGAAPALGAGEALARLGAAGVDVVVPQMFCPAGMTSFRAVWDVLGVPLLGNTAAAMALTMDKARAKAVVAAAGVAVAAGEVLRPGGVPSVAPPAVVKPVDADNSLGVSLVRHPREWDVALAAGFAHGGAVLVEEYVPLGREVRCGLVERRGELVGLPLEEYAVDPEAKPIRGADDKLRPADAGLALVAKDADHAWVVDPADPATEVVWEVARRCHVALGCRHYSLFDLRIDPEGRPVFLEASLYCSYAPTSVLATMAAAAGIGVRELFDLGLSSLGLPA